MSPHEVRPLRAESCRGGDFVVAGGSAGCQNDSLRCHWWRQGGIVATLCLPVPKLSPGNTLHVLPENTWQYITMFRWSMWSYLSITIDDGGSLSLRQLMVPPVTVGLSGWRPSIFGDGIGSWYITMYIGVCHYICKCIPWATRFRVCVFENFCKSRTFVSQDCQVSFKLGATLSAPYLPWLIFRIWFWGPSRHAWISYQTCCSRSCL